MPRFEPFAGLRYDVDRLDPADVTAPPYDVLSEADVAALAARSDRNVVRIDVPEPDEDAGRDRYAQARHLLDAWCDDGTFVRAASPSFYLYRMEFTDEHGQAQQTAGVIGALEVSRPSEGGDVLPHEQTTPKARTDRLDLLRATDANLSPVWGLSLASGLGALCDRHDPPLARWLDGDGVAHQLWVVDDPATLEAIAAVVGSGPVLIADGHHRYHVALEHRDALRAGSSDATAGPAELTMALVVELSPEQLHVRAIHRLVAGLSDDVDLAEALAGSFDVLDAGTDDPAALLDRMDEVGALGLIVAGRAPQLLRPKPGAFDGVAELDSSRLDHALVATGLPYQLTYQHGADLVAERVADGTAQAAVLLRPVTVAQIGATASARGLMPPKSTFFWPKPRTGVVIRTL